MTTKSAVLKAIRAYCLECCNGSSKEVDECNVGSNTTSAPGRCALHLFRHGTDPNPSRKGFAGKTPRIDDEIIDSCSCKAQGDNNGKCPAHCPGTLPEEAME